MTRTLASLALLLAACGNPSLDAPDDLGGADALGPADDLAPPPDLAPPRRDPTDHPPLFHLDHQGGPVLAHMAIYTIVWKGDETLGAQMDAFHGAMLASSYWTDRLGQYGVGAGTSRGVLVIPTPAPATVDGSMLEQLLEQNLASGAWPKADGDSVYAFIVPATTTVTSWGETGCTSFGGYHEESATGVPYIVDLQCEPGFDNLTYVASHEAAECATDPHTSSNPGWYTAGAGEIGDVCVGSPARITVAGDADAGAPVAYSVTRLYSNADALRGDVDPCGPNPSGWIFFNAALAPSDITLTTGANGEGDATVMVEPFAYGNVGKMKWQVLLDLGMGDAGLVVTPSRGTASAGDTIPLTIHASPNAQFGAIPISIYVETKSGTNTWYGTVTVQ